MKQSALTSSVHAEEDRYFVISEQMQILHPFEMELDVH